MDKIIVLIDDNGCALGAVCRREKNLILVDNSGKIIQTVSIKTTIKEAKEILLRKKLSYVR